jgi:hypothetical protein
MIIATLIEMGKLLAVMCVLGAALAAYPRTRRVAYASVRFGKGHMSPWMAVVTGVCLVIPGPDEFIVVPALLVLTLRTRRNRRIYMRYVRTAWASPAKAAKAGEGFKAHRQSSLDGTPCWCGRHHDY